jgi:hypothetical protein
MNSALTYLWFALLKRKALRFVGNLRRPTTLIGFAALVFLLGFCFHHRRQEIFANLIRPEVLIAGALVMLGGSVFKGFLQRGLVFEPPDVQFLFTSPFTQRQIVLYRLLPSYLFAFAQSLVFLALFASHLKHPVLTAACLTLFQIACFHIASGAAIFAGTISETAHYRIRWILLGTYFVITALYLRKVLELKLIPSFVASPLTQVFFYPALTVSDIAVAPITAQWAVHLVEQNSIPMSGFWQPMLYVALFAFGAAMSLWLLLRLKADIFETSLATTARVAERNLRVQQGRAVVDVKEAERRSAPLPKARLFRGVGAIIWKNLIAAVRSKRELGLAAAFTFIYTGFLVALRWAMHYSMSQGGSLPDKEVMDFDKIIGGMLCMQGFLLQRAFPFDFRRDGNHLLGFRTLPVTPLALTLAELAVPTAFCLGFQLVGMMALMIFAHFDWLTALTSLLLFPAIVVALNGVWNLHYLLAASRRAGGKAESASPVALLMVVALSFLIFYPAGWTAVLVGKHTFGRYSEALAFASGVAVQYFVDFLLVLALARLFQRYEISRDSS